MQEIFIPLFLVDCRLIRIDVSDNFVNLSEQFFKQMSGDSSFEKKTQGSVLYYCALASVRITGLLDIASTCI